LTLYRNSENKEGVCATIARAMHRLSQKLCRPFAITDEMQLGLAGKDGNLMRPMDVLDKDKWKQLSVVNSAATWKRKVVLVWKDNTITIPMEQVCVNAEWPEQYDEARKTFQNMQEHIASPPQRHRNVSSTSRAKRKATCEVHILDRSHAAVFFLAFAYTMTLNEVCSNSFV
jgi:hypothetical protein